MNNYYDVLGLTAFESSQETIEQAYKEGTQRMSEVTNSDWAGQLVLFNEAYLVLSDVALKQHYDYSLRYNSPSTYLEQGIEEKRKRAKAFVESKLSLTVPLRKESSMSTLVKVLIVVAVAMLCARLINIVHSAVNSAQRASAVELGSYVPDGDWNRYELDNAFSIYIPGTMELKAVYKPFVTPMGSNFTAIDNDEAVFLRGQRFMSANNGHDTYCCVTIFHATGTTGDAE